jgi:hypothetical protein
MIVSSKRSVGFDFWEINAVDMRALGMKERFVAEILAGSMRECSTYFAPVWVPLRHDAIAPPAVH